MKSKKGNRRLRVRVRFLLFCFKLAPMTGDVTCSVTLLGRKKYEAMSDEHPRNVCCKGQKSIPKIQSTNKSLTCIRNLNRLISVLINVDFPHTVQNRGWKYKYHTGIYAKILLARGSTLPTFISTS